MRCRFVRWLGFASLATLLLGCEGNGLLGSSADRKAFDKLITQVNYGSPDGDGPFAIPPEYQDKIYECYRGEAKENDVSVAELTAALNEISARETNADLPPGTPQHRYELGNYLLTARQLILNCQNTLIPPSAIRAFVQKVDSERPQKEAEKKQAAVAAMQNAEKRLDAMKNGQFAALDTSGKNELPNLGFTQVTGPEDSSAYLSNANLADYRGTVVVVRFWSVDDASVAAEMPTLATLQKTFSDGNVLVLPVASTFEDVPLPADPVAWGLSEAELSMVRTSSAALRRMVGDSLKLYADSNGELAKALGVSKAPTTIIFDKSGNEVARLSGAADWSTAQAKALIDEVIKRPEAD